jgi:hypothetical protein
MSATNLTACEGFEAVLPTQDHSVIVKVLVQTRSIVVTANEFSNTVEDYIFI